MKVAVKTLQYKGKFALVRMCLLDASGAEDPNTVRFLIFKLPEWEQLFQSTSEFTATVKFNELVKNDNDVAHTSSSSTTSFGPS